MSHWPTASRSSRRARISFAVSFLGLLAIPTPAMAQASPREDATRKLQEGNAFFQLRQYEAALGRYLEAQALYPSPRLDYNIASAYDELDKAAQAATFYARFLREFKPGEVDDTRTVALERLAKLSPRVGQLELRCAIEGAKVLLDGQALGQMPLASIYIAPGAHVLEAQHPRHPRFTQEFSASAGAKVTVVVPWEPSSTASPAHPARLFSAATPEPAKRAELRRRKTVWGYAALGVGLGLAATAGVLYGVGFAKGGDAFQAYQDAVNEGKARRLPASQAISEMDAHYADVESAKHQLIAADVLAGAAALSLAFSIYELVTRPAAEAPSAREAFLRVEPRQAGLGLLGSF